MAVIEKLSRWATLLGIVGVALGSLVIDACTDRSTGKAQADASLPDSSLPDAQMDAEPLPDADLWDVVCE